MVLVLLVYFNVSAYFPDNKNINIILACILLFVSVLLGNGTLVGNGSMKLYKKTYKFPPL